MVPNQSKTLQTILSDTRQTNICTTRRNLSILCLIVTFESQGLQKRFGKVIYVTFSMSGFIYLSLCTLLIVIFASHNSKHIEGRLLLHNNLIMKMQLPLITFLKTLHTGQINNNDSPLFF